MKERTKPGEGGGGSPCDGLYGEAPPAIVFYYSGLLRVELKGVNEQKKWINALESNETTSSDFPNQLAKKTRGKFVFNRV